MWNYPLYFSQDAVVLSSTDPCNYETYIGPEAASEPETQNVISIIDSNPHIRYLDLHSSGEDILYSWGDSEDQTTDEDMNFHNHRFDGLRGDKSYKEFISSTDRSWAIKLAESMALAINAVRGREYSVKPSIALYPTSGASDDYSFSRHFAHNDKGKVISYTIEWGRSGNSADITHFHPPILEMQNITQEIVAGLVQFCIDISNS